MWVQLLFSGSQRPYVHNLFSVFHQLCRNFGLSTILGPASAKQIKRQKKCSFYRFYRVQTSRGHRKATFKCDKLLLLYRLSIFIEASREIGNQVGRGRLTERCQKVLKGRAWKRSYFGVEFERIVGFFQAGRYQ